MVWFPTPQTLRRPPKVQKNTVWNNDHVQSLSYKSLDLPSKILSKAAKISWAMDKKFKPIYGLKPRTRPITLSNTYISICLSETDLFDKYSPIYTLISGKMSNLCPKNLKMDIITIPLFAFLYQVVSLTKLQIFNFFNTLFSWKFQD